MTTPSQASGLATIGTVSPDCSCTYNTTGSSYLGVFCFTAPITGTGSLNMTVGSSTAVAWTVGFSEFANMAANPYQASVTYHGSTNAESTGNITPTYNGIVIEVTADSSLASISYTPSDTIIFSQGDGLDNETGTAQFKVVNGGTQYNLIETASGTAIDWISIGAAYKAL